MPKKTRGLARGLVKMFERVSGTDEYIAYFPL